MSANSEQRKLAAIMFTDMVGYSALSQRDDQLAQQLLEEHRTLLRSIFPGFRGQEIKTIGDAFLVEFGSALEAAQCGIEIQRALAKRNHDVTPDRRIELKIGIHIGDVVHRDGDVYGDGVNIASRIEPLAGAGGICVSMDVERQIRNALEARFEKLAPTDLKNIKLPMELFRIVLPWESLGTGGAAVPPRKSVPLIITVASVTVLAVLAWFLFLQPKGESKLVRPGQPNSTNKAPAGLIATPPDSKSIAVLPFTNMSEETNNAFFADGIHEEILTTLALLHDLKVVSRTSVAQYRNTTKSMRQIAQELGVAYVLEGSVRRAGNKVRVTGQLIRAGSDEHVWAKSYDRDLTDVFAIQSALATEIAGALQAAISPQEKSLIARRPTENTAAYDAYLKARQLLREGGVTSMKDYYDATALLEEAVRLDPKFAAAWAELSIQHGAIYFDEIDRTEQRKTRAKEAIDRAVQLAPEDPEVIRGLGLFHYLCYRDYPRAMEQYQRLLALVPNDAETIRAAALIQRRQGHWRESIVAMRRAAQIDPRNLECLESLRDTAVALRLFDEAERTQRSIVELTPGNQFHVAFLSVISFLARGSLTEMKDWMAKLKPAQLNEPSIVEIRKGCAVSDGDLKEFLRLDQQQPHSDAFGQSFGAQDVRAGFVLKALGQSQAAQARAQDAIGDLKARLEKEPTSSLLWQNLCCAHTLLGNKEEALRCGQKAMDLLPESNDALAGVEASANFAMCLAHLGEKDRSLSELTRLLLTPSGPNVFAVKSDPSWAPLRGDPRFEALMSDPKNKAPLLDSSGQILP